MDPNSVNVPVKPQANRLVGTQGAKLLGKAIRAGRGRIAVIAKLQEYAHPLIGPSCLSDPFHYAVVVTMIEHRELDVISKTDESA